jgi:hypothetical protein
MRERALIDRLRREFPQVSPEFFDAMEARAELHELRGQLCYLVGFHGRAGAVPVGELRGLLGLVSDHDAVGGAR